MRYLLVVAERRTLNEYNWLSDPPPVVLAVCRRLHYLNIVSRYIAAHSIRTLSPHTHSTHTASQTTFAPAVHQLPLAD